MSSKVDKIFKDAEKLPEDSENHGIKDKLYNDTTRTVKNVTSNSTLPAKNETTDKDERWVKVVGNKVNDTSEQNKKTAAPMQVFSNGTASANTTSAAKPTSN